MGARIGGERTCWREFRPSRLGVTRGKRWPSCLALSPCNSSCLSWILLDFVSSPPASLLVFMITLHSLWEMPCLSSAKSFANSDVLGTQQTSCCGVFSYHTAKKQVFLLIFFTRQKVIFSCPTLHFLHVILHVQMLYFLNFFYN
jgi:hypothetical protein